MNLIQKLDLHPKSVRNNNSLASGGISTNIYEDLALFVSSTGNDTNDGLTSATPFKTPHKAFNWLSRFKITDDATVTINVAAGSYYFTAPIKLYHPDGMRIRMVGAAMLGNRTSGVDATGSGDKLQSTGSSAAQRAADLAFNKAKIEARWATKLYFSNGSDGLLAVGGHLGWCDKIALIGDGSAAIGASNYDGTANGNTTIKFSPDSAIVGFGNYNLFNQFGGSIYAGNATVVGAGNYNLFNSFGGSIYAGNANIDNAGGTGLLAKGSGSVIYYSGTATCSPALGTVGNGGAFIGVL